MFKGDKMKEIEKKRQKWLVKIIAKERNPKVQLQAIKLLRKEKMEC